MKQPKSTQRGITFFGFLFVAVVLACVGVVAAQVFPTILELQAINRAVNKAAIDGQNVPEIRAIFDKQTEIDTIKSISGKDLDISKVGEKVVVSFSYQREIPLFGPAFLTLKYAGRSK